MTRIFNTNALDQLFPEASRARLAYAIIAMRERGYTAEAWMAMLKSEVAAHGGELDHRVAARWLVRLIRREDRHRAHV